ncbi:MAG: caspase family protein [Deltaproteobacteria bacterium]|nr:caspase family protein [Deltaproteobacteria bacterium]
MMKRYQVLVVFVLVFVVSEAFGDTRKFALILGNNEGHDDDKTLRFAERDARKLYRVLVDLGGFSKEDSQLLLGANEREATRAIDELERRIVERSKEPGDKTLLLFYYSGHAEGDLLELGQSSLKLERILSFLRSSKADVRLAFLDSCHSGKLISMKGGRRGPQFDIRVTDEITSSGYAIITSSADNELSQESVEIRGAFFTHYLVSALRGAGDKSGDGKVTLTEAYQHAYSRTLARTSVTIGGSQHPMYEFQLEGRGDVVLTNTTRGGSQLAIEIARTGRLVVLDHDNEVLVAEVEIKSGQRKLLALNAGSYTAYFLTPDEGVHIAKAQVTKGERAVLDTDDFRSIELVDAVSKGGLFQGPKAYWTHRLGAGGLWRLWALAGATSSWGASIHYRLESPEGWQPAVRMTWTTRSDVEESKGYNDLGALVGVGYVWSFNRVALRGEILAGYEHLFQDNVPHSSGFGYLGVFGAEVKMSDYFVCLDAGAGGRVFKVQEKGTVHRLDVQAILSLGWRWSV